MRQNDICYRQWQPDVPIYKHPSASSCLADKATMVTECCLLAVVAALYHYLQYVLFISHGARILQTLVNKFC